MPFIDSVGDHPSSGHSVDDNGTEGRQHRDGDGGEVLLSGYDYPCRWFTKTLGHSVPQCLRDHASWILTFQFPGSIVQGLSMFLVNWAAALQ